MAGSWKALLRADPTDWLLDQHDPGARYLALKDVFGLKSGEPDLEQAAAAAHHHAPIAELLDSMHPEGYWEKPGHGYLPKYRSTVWSLITLAQLGAHRDYDQRIAASCDYALEHTAAQGTRFSATGAPSGTADCLQGNMCTALLDLGVEHDRLAQAFEWMARTVTGEGLAPNYDRTAEMR